MRVTEWRQGGDTPKHLAYRYVDKADLSADELEAIEARNKTLIATSTRLQHAKEPGR